MQHARDAVTPHSVQKSEKLQDVCYDIRGPVLETAMRMEEEGYRILRLNTGNPGAFGFDAPDEILRDVIHNLHLAQAYGDSNGLFSARKAVMQHFQELGVADIDIPDIYLGNGVSELIQIAVQALLNNDEEILIPSPDYPLWTAATTMAGGVPVYYRCDEQAEWQPDTGDLRKKITPRTRALVVINPNNPTGAVYSREVLEEIVEIARQHRLVLFTDEIYEKILYDEAQYIPLATLAPDLLCLTFSGLSKNYRLAGFRAGWMALSGMRQGAESYIEGLNIICSMRLCANMPAQYAIQTALGGYQSVDDLVAPGGRLYEQRELAWQMLNAIPGVDCLKPKGTIYLFPRLDRKRYPVDDDEQLVLEFLKYAKILLVQGSAFSYPHPDHLRFVFLPTREVLQDAITKFEQFLAQY